MTKKVFHTRVAQSVIERVVEQVKKRWPVTTQSEAIARALEDWVNNAEGNGKSAKLDKITVLIEWLVAQHQRRIELEATFPVDEYTAAKAAGCDSVEDGQ